MIHLQLTAYPLGHSFLNVYVCAANHRDNSGSQTQWAFWREFLRKVLYTFTLKKGPCFLLENLGAF